MDDLAIIVRLTEADLTFDEVRQAVCDAIEDQLGVDQLPNAYTWVQDLATDWVVYRVDGVPDTEDGLYRCAYTIADDGTVTLTGTPEQVHVEYAPLTEARDHLSGRILEARGSDADGGRIFAVQIIERGTSRNGNRYPLSVLTEAAPLYEGAKSFDHHRTEAEHRTSSVAGLVGRWENVSTNFDGLEGELHVLPSRSDIAEAFDASLAAQENGGPPLIGVSHDVQAQTRRVTEGSRRLLEATKIVNVLSVDVVADPSAGGKALRMVAGGTGGTEPQEGIMDLKQLLALLRDADDAKRAELLTEHADLIADWGLDEAAITRILTETPLPAPPAPAPAPAAAENEPTEAEYAKDSIMGKQLVKTAVGDAGVGEQAEQVTEAIMARLPDRFTETQLTEAVENFASVMRLFESASLGPRVQHVGVAGDAYDRMVEGMDKFFSGDFSVFHSFKQMYAAFTGSNPTSFGEDYNREILRESFGESYDSRLSESATTTTWSKALGDSITRRLVTEYNVPALQDWQAITSSVVPINDFRTQRIDRVGGYGTLPTVNEGAPYQPLTTPSDEEITYALSKKGGTEDLTLEVIANDDVRWISRIPTRLGLAAARTLHDAIFGILSSNPNCSYDSTALFHANHSNTAAVALSYANYVSQRAAMRRQAGYGDTANILDLTPAILIVPPELEGIADQLVRGTNAPPATTPGATNVPNLAQGTKLVVKGLLSDTNDWFLSADPAMVPTIEVGFYQGRRDPELFTQADGTVGSMFNADKMTIKIRHIWSYAVLDHRGFQRGTQ